MALTATSWPAATAATLSASVTSPATALSTSVCRAGSRTTGVTRSPRSRAPAVIRRPARPPAPNTTKEVMAGTVERETSVTAT
ncbi:hypothetical protein GCM10027610_092380 [Dactylosporangium cerinum]